MARRTLEGIGKGVDARVTWQAQASAAAYALPPVLRASNSLQPATMRASQATAEAPTPCAVSRDFHIDRYRTSAVLRLKHLPRRSG